MKLSNLLCLIIFLTAAPCLFAQPEPAPTPVRDLLQTSVQEKVMLMTGVSLEAQQKLGAATKLMLEGKCEESIAANSNIIKSYPKIMIAYNNRGYCYMQLGEFDAAIADFNTALRLSPTALTYNNRGMTYLKKTNYDNALADLSKAIELNPQDALAYNNRGILYTQLEKFDLALADQNKALSLAPKEALYLSNRCYSSVKLKMAEPAIKDCTDAIGLNPNMAIAYANRGAAYILLSSFEPPRCPISARRLGLTLQWLIII